MSNQPLEAKRIQQLLEHVHSLHVVSVPDQISKRDAHELVQRGYLYACWPGNYALTDAGKRARGR